MEGVTKIYPPQKTVLKNIWLSFYYGAKIGVLGLNGSGKSSLLKIIAGLDTNFQGKVTFDRDYKIGYLEQEPTLDESKTVRQIVEEGVQHIVDVIKAYEDINNKLCEPLDDDEMCIRDRLSSAQSGPTTVIVAQQVLFVVISLTLAIIFF